MRRAGARLDAVETLVVQLEINKLPPATREVRFHPVRMWRFDCAWPERKVAVECEGGAWSNGRHTRGSGYIADMEKYNEATLLGWRVFRFTPQQIRHGVALSVLQQVFQ